MSARARLPARRPQLTVPLRHNWRDFTVSFGGDGSTPDIREVFVTSARAGTGSEESYLATDGSILISLALQHGCPIETIAHALLRGEDGGPATLLGAVADLVLATERARA